MNTKLPPGRYFIGDPCYVFSHEDWVAFACDAILDGHETMKGKPYFAAHTLNGDGVYHGTNNFDFGVDAGLLGAIPEALISKTPNPEDGLLVDYPNGVLCSENDGLFKFSDLLIDTRQSSEDIDDDSFHRRPPR